MQYRRRVLPVLILRIRDKDVPPTELGETSGPAALVGETLGLDASDSGQGCPAYRIMKRNEGDAKNKHRFRALLDCLITDGHRL